MSGCFFWALRSISTGNEELAVSDMGLERPVADSVEQGRDVLAESVEPEEDGPPRELPLEANEADAAEQERALGHDEDDYR